MCRVRMCVHAFVCACVHEIRPIGTDSRIDEEETIALVHVEAKGSHRGDAVPVRIAVKVELGHLFL